MTLEGWRSFFFFYTIIAKDASVNELVVNGLRYYLSSIKTQKKNALQKTARLNYETVIKRENNLL